MNGMAYVPFIGLGDVSFDTDIDSFDGVYKSGLMLQPLLIWSSLSIRFTSESLQVSANHG